MEGLENQTVKGHFGLGTSSKKISTTGVLTCKDTDSQLIYV